MDRHADDEIMIAALQRITLEIKGEYAGRGFSYPWGVLMGGLVEIRKRAQQQGSEIDIRRIFVFLNTIQTLAADLRALMSGMRLSEDAAEIKRLRKALGEERALFGEKMSAPINEDG